jgi:hypothetical protein
MANDLLGSRESTTPGSEGFAMTRLVRWILSLEAAAFFAAALVHSGVLLRGYEHREAAVAESVIGLVLGAAVLASVLAPRSSRAAGLGAQGFALLGTFVGLFTIAIGVGPRTAPDLAFHGGIVAVLIAGLVLLGRRPAGPPQGATP